MSAAQGAKIFHGIRKLQDRFDLFVVDVWGTLHNGVTAYPGAIDALARLKDRGKHVVLLSNAPRRTAIVADTLETLGIKRDLYSVLLTSGEAVHTALRDRPDEWHRRLHGPCWHLGPTRERGIFEGLNLDLRAEPEGCGFCVATGARMNEERVEDYQDALDRALSLGLPMICANPDIRVPAGDMLVICAGAFAEYYAAKGGDVFWHGKPYSHIYRHLFSVLEAQSGEKVDLARTVVIGDALATDIAGAVGAGIASGLLVGGIHRQELKLNWRGLPRRKLLAALIDSAAAKPDYVLRRFAW